MSGIQKSIVAVLAGATAASFILFGLWEDKAWLYVPVLTLVYLASAAWAVPAAFTRRRNPAPAVPPGGLPLLLFWLYSCALIPFSVLPYEAKISSLGFGAYLALYWVSANLLSRFSRRQAVWLTLFILLVFAALYGLVQHRTAPNLIFGIERYTTYWEAGRLGGTYQCPNHIAHLFQLWLPLGLAFLFIPQFGWFWRICFTYGLLLFLLLIYQTQSRAGLLGTVAAGGVMVLLMILRKSRRAFFLALLLVPLAGAGVLGGLWAGSAMFRSRMMPVVKFVNHVVSGAAVEEAFNDFRPQTWLDTIEMIKDRPLCGVGPGNYGLVYEEYRTRFQALRIETVHPHNEYLELTAEYGLIGAALILWALLSVCLPLLRLVRTAPNPRHALPAAALLAALAGTAVHGFFDFELRILPNALMLALLAGCAVAPLLQDGPDRHPKRTRAVQWVFALTITLAALWTVQVMSSAWIRVRGDRLLLTQNFTQAERLYQIAGWMDPQNWRTQWGLGRVYYYHRYAQLDPALKRDWAQKERAAYAAALRINAKKEEVVYGLGCAELFLGNREQGLDYLRRAANYKRFNDFYWRKLGIELRKAGLYPEALAAFEYAQKLDSSNATVKRNIQWLKAKTGAAGVKK